MAAVGVGTVTAPVNVDVPETAKLVNVPTLVIPVCAALTDKVDPDFVNPVPAVRYVNPSM